MGVRVHELIGVKVKSHRFDFLPFSGLLKHPNSTQTPTNQIILNDLCRIICICQKNVVILQAKFREPKFRHIELALGAYLSNRKHPIFQQR